MLHAADYLGEWHLKRTLIDNLGTMSGTMEGVATFTPRPDGDITYQEAGQLVLNSGAAMQAERTYIWRWIESAVAVFFADGAPFHQFTPSGPAVGTSHLCGDDLYNVTYDLTGWPQWEAVWQVRGPRKDYTSHSVYTRP